MSPPLFTRDLPGVGGRIKVAPEDFDVEEVPSYEPCGSGDHLFLWMEKTGVAPEFFARGVAQRLGISPGDVGTAGLKDRHAVTRQWVSVPASCEAHVSKLDAENVRVLKTARHTNKLKPGHLKGNRFRILVRGANDPTCPDPQDRAATEAREGRKQAAAAVLDRIRTHGLPNFYGPQRFGRDGSTLELGMKCLAGKAPKRIRPFLFRFALSAVQSVLFNDYLARRIHDGLFRTVLDGDVMTKWPAGGMFVATDVPAEQARFDARETVTAGPMFGKKTFPSAGEAEQREAAVLRDNGLSLAAFGGFGKLVLGTRRQNLVYLDDLAAEWEPDGLRLTFTLPAGSYATVLLAEVTKAPLDAEPDDEDEGEV